MFAKLCVLVVGIGVIACGLLSLRQARVQLGHEAAVALTKVERHDHDLWVLRGAIASKTTPQSIQARAESKFGVLAPINTERYQELVRREQEAEALQAVTVLEPGR